MIHPCLATMLVVITTDYPLAAGEAEALPAAGRRADASTGSRSTATARRTTRWCCSRTARAAPRATTTAFAAALDEVCADLARQIVADGEGATVVLEIGVTGAASAAEAEAIARRIATSPLVKTAAFGHDPNWGRVLVAAGSAPFERRLRAARDRPAHRRVRRRRGVRRAARRPALVARARRARSCRIDLDLGLGDGAAGYLASDLTYDYVRHQRGVHDVSRIVLKLGGRVAAGGGRARRSRCGATGHDVVVVHGAGPADHGGDGAARDRADVRRRAPRDDRRGARGRARVARRRSNAEVCAAIGPARVAALRRRDRPSRRRRSRRSGSSAIPIAVGAGRDRRGARRRADPGRRAARRRRGPLNVNADEAAAALAVGLGAERIVFVSDVPGVLHGRRA